jgi:hypothetical protein
MRGKATKSDKKNIASKSKRKDDNASHEFETMSQIQNRYGHGRKQNGSDGTSTQARGSNH